MRNLIPFAVALLVVVGVCALPASAEESFRGTVIVTDAGCVHNLFPTDGGAFAIGVSALVTVQPDQNAYVCVDQVAAATSLPNCTSTNGVRIDQNVAFPSSCNNQQVKPVRVEDGGLVSSCVVQVCPVSGASVNAKVWERQGNEGL